MQAKIRSQLKYLLMAGQLIPFWKCSTALQAQPQTQEAMILHRTPLPIPEFGSGCMTIMVALMNISTLDNIQIAYSENGSTPTGVSAGVVDVQVVQWNDDAEEALENGNDDDDDGNFGGAMYLDSTDLELIADGSTDQVIGLRFQNVTVPQNATISQAYIEFIVDETDSSSTSLVFRTEASDNAGSFSASSYNISGRTTSAASVNWNNINAWNSVGQTHQTPDLKSIVQEVVNRGGWDSGNAMAFIITGSGERTVEAYDGKSESSTTITH